MIKPKSLLVKLLTHYVPLVGLSVLLLFGVLEYQYYHQERAELVLSLNRTAEVQKDAIANALWGYDLDQINELITKTGQLPFIHAVEVFDSNGKSVSQAGDIHIPAEADDFTLDQPITYRTEQLEETVGRIVISVHSDDIITNVISHLKTNSLILLVLMGALIAVTWFVTQRLILRPLGYLHGSIKRMNEEHYWLPAVWDSSDEIGIVIGAYNYMQEKQLSTEATLTLNAEELKNYQEHLEVLVDERTQELSNAKDQLTVAKEKAEDATKAKATFLATMSHEIRTPMNGVVGMVEILQQTKLTEDQRQMVNTVNESAFSLLTIINDILDFSKIEAGKLDLEEIPISIRDVVEGAGEALAVNARNKNIGLSVFVDPDIPDALLGDQVRLRQIIFNFGTNAIKFTEKGKVLIRVDLLPSEMEDKANLRFQVIDNGIGIPKEAQESLFQAFSQVEASTTRRFGGTGLGLSICQRLIEMMNGEIGVESVPGKGSTFSATITLPIAPEHTIKSEGIDLSGLNILLAIGDDDMRGLLPRYLEKWGAKVAPINKIDTVAPLVIKSSKTEKPFDIVYLNSAWPLAERIKLVEYLATEETLSSTRYVLACSGRLRAERKDMDHTVYVDSDPLRRGALIKSIAVAAGRASPDVEYEVNEIALNTGEAPNVDEAEAMGQLILLAEDNLTNQDVISRQLKLLGYTIEIANDGVEALKLMETRSYALLLSDCHMPNMDGYVLSQTIRSTEKNTDKHFPIIAVTASVMKDEVDRCIAAGMDDYLAKPLEMTKLKEMLAKWMPKSGKIIAEASNEPAASETTDAPIIEDSSNVGNSAVDPSALKSIFGDDDETFKEILCEFVEPATSNVGEIEAAFTERTADGVAKAAHKLKSSARSIGANELADLCQLLETAGKAGDWNEIDKAAPGLASIFQSVLDYIKTL